MREEVRLATAAGVGFDVGEEGDVVVGVAPHVVLWGGPLDVGACEGCAYEPTRYEPSWSVTLTLGVAANP